MPTYDILTLVRRTTLLAGGDNKNNEMPGLIPLLLKPSSTYTHRISLSLEPARSHSRQSSAVERPRPVSFRRLSLLPRTRAEWKRTISDVKRQHFDRMYQVCSARCCEILDNIKDTSEVEPFYLVCLHFYAATSLELCARPLSSTSAHRPRLLGQARIHFSRAAALLPLAEDAVVMRVRASSANSSRLSSCHSPSESISSRTWTPDTGFSSPTTSICSLDDLTTPTSSLDKQRQKRAKRVAFSLPTQAPPSSPSAPFEVVFRPDSPTLGCDSCDAPANSALPDVSELPDIEHKPEAQTESEFESEQEESPEAESLLQDGAFAIARSLHRYCEDLRVLRAQIASSQASLDQLLWPGAGWGLPDMLAEMSSVRLDARDKLRALDRQVRIDRLRKSGWQRKRFDPTRYQELCDAVMAELNSRVAMAGIDTGS